MSESKQKISKPKIYVAMPCYGDMKVETCVSLLDTFSTLGRAGIECRFKSVKSSLVTHARNLLTAGFMDSECDYMLFVDADVEFPAEAVARMLVPKKDVIITPYRLKENPNVEKYPVKFKDPNDIRILPWDLVELESGPAGLMLIAREVFITLMKEFPEGKINFNEATRAKMNKEIGSTNDAIDKYMYNFWDTSFINSEWKGEDMAFCELCTEVGIPIYANIESWTTHHGSWGFNGKFGDILVKKA